MKTAEQLKPSYAPVYAAAMYPELCPIFHKHGYALAVHGSLARDFDLIAVPWVSKVSRPEVVIDELLSTFALRKVGEMVLREHGRMVQTLSVGFGQCACDLSFMPADVS